jgi:hypothetical protein
MIYICFYSVISLMICGQMQNTMYNDHANVEAHVSGLHDNDCCCKCTINKLTINIKTDGTWVLDGGYKTDYTYTCNTTTNTYTLTIPRSYLTESLHGTT